MPHRVFLTNYLGVLKMKIAPLMAPERAEYLHHLRQRCTSPDGLSDSSLTEEILAFADQLFTELKSAEQQYADLTAALPQMLWLTRPDGFHFYFNEKWVEYTGRSIEQSLGFGWLEAFHPDDRERTINSWQQATSTGQAYEIEYRLRRADGSYGWVLGRALPLRDASGEICRWFGSCTDIDSQKKSEELAAKQAAALALANEQLIKTEQLKSDFFSNVSHELRTPLTLLLAPVESLLSGDYGPITNDQSPLLHIIHNNALRLLQMVSGLLDFAKLEAKKFEPDLESTNVVALTESIFNDFQPLMRKKQIIGDFISWQAEIWLTIDRYIWQRIVFNLLSNAVKFTPESGRVTVSLEYSDGRLILQVSDTGIGIASQDIPLLFEKFRQVESASTRRFEGTGIGLALVKEFTELLGGHVAVVSTPSKGTTFTVECPLSLADAQSAAPLAQTSLSQWHLPLHVQEIEIGERQIEGQDESTKILVVEDNPELGRYIVAQIQHLGITKHARDGEEALEIVSKWHPDLILSDVMMPKRDGISLCREIKSRPETAAIPVILLTALTHREALISGWEAGADEYLFKPFHPRELSARVQSMLALSRERRRHAADLIKANEELESKVLERTTLLREANIELKQRVESERAARLEAERLTHIKDEFLITLSHELRTPLVPILGWIGLINTGTLSNIEATEALRTIERSARHELQLIEDLLDTSRMITGKLSVDFKLINVIESLQAAIETVRLTAIAKNITLNIDIPEGATYNIRGESRRMQQVFWNLLGNAVKFTDKGGRIDVRASTSDGWVNISISDSGVGIKPDFLPNVFERFRQADSSTTRKHGGLGLGLALVRNLVEVHGGQVRVDSAGENQGSTFTVKLPLYNSQQVTQPSSLRGLPLSNTLPATADKKLHGLRVLVVDDSSDDGNYLSALLKQNGADVTIVANAADALEQVKTQLPDVMVSDIGMPCRDGYELMQDIRALQPPVAKLPAIAITAYGNDIDRAKALAAGFQRHITKPADTEQLINAIYELAHRSGK
jgi:PAS domain S-box-containing protein